MKKGYKGLATAALAGVLALSVAGCGGSPAPAGSEPAKASSDYKVQMVTDMGGVNDRSFNQLAWEGLQKLNKETGIEVGYTESKQEADYATNLDKAVDSDAQTVWGIGFAMAGAIRDAAKPTPTCTSPSSTMLTPRRATRTTRVTRTASPTTSPA